MRMSRRAVLHGIGGVDYSYTGSFDAFGNASRGYLVLKTSGTLSIEGTVDLCLVGGGGKGYQGGSDSGSGGGAGGYVSNYTEQNLNDNFTVTIGSGSSTQGSAGGKTSVGASFTANGGNSPAAVRVSVTGRGTSGSGALWNTDALPGEDGIYPWNDSTNFSSFRVSGCGGGGCYKSVSAKTEGAGGAGGGGAGGNLTTGIGVSGSANTGGGGGGGGTISGTKYNGGNGGSGVVFICWGYNHS